MYIKASENDEWLKTLKTRAYGIYPRKGYIIVDGSNYYKLKELKWLSLNFRLSLPHDVFVAIDKA